MAEQWIYTHEDRYPSDNRTVAVLVAHKDGSFSADAGRYYGKRGWSLNCGVSSPVVGWVSLPGFKDHVEIVDADEAA